MDGTMDRVEVITSVERRRRWSAAEKQEMVAESAKPGRTVSGVARRFGIAPQQLFTWRRQLDASNYPALVSERSDIGVRRRDGSLIAVMGRWLGAGRWLDAVGRR